MCEAAAGATTIASLGLKMAQYTHLPAELILLILTYHRPLLYYIWEESPGPCDGNEQYDYRPQVICQSLEAAVQYCLRNDETVIQELEVGVAFDDCHTHYKITETELLRFQTEPTDYVSNAFVGADFERFHTETKVRVSSWHDGFIYPDHAFRSNFPIQQWRDAIPAYVPKDEAQKTRDAAIPLVTEAPLSRSVPFVSLSPALSSSRSI